jgi:hypothetical protein
MGGDAYACTQWLPRHGCGCWHTQQVCFHVQLAPRGQPLALKLKSLHTSGGQTAVATALDALGAPPFWPFPACHQGGS